MLSERLRQARLASGLTLRDLAQKAGTVSAAAISKYENGKDRPRQAVLVSIARALDIPLGQLLTPPSVDLAVVEYRKKKNLPDCASETILAKVKSDLESYVDLSELLSNHGAPQFDTSVALTEVIGNLTEVDKYASVLRDRWSLGTDPIRNVIETVENAGAKVISIDADSRFDELACIANGKYPVIVLKNLKPGKGDRQRFNILHGLGHLLLCNGERIDKEKMCHRFAASMLAPREAALKRLGVKRRDLDIDYELPKLKEEFGMSIKAWVIRAWDLEIIDNATRLSLFKRISQKGWNQDEPVPIPIETPSRFELMVSRARAEGIITPVRAAALMGGLRRKPHTRLSAMSVPDHAADDYVAGGPLDSWDDIEPKGPIHA